MIWYATILLAKLCESVSKIWILKSGMLRSVSSVSSDQAIILLKLQILHM